VIRRTERRSAWINAKRQRSDAARLELLPSKQQKGNKHMLSIRNSFFCGLLLAAGSLGAFGQSQTPPQDSDALLHRAEAIRKQLITLPQYGVFDNLHFATKGSTVILRGQASRPSLKSAAENVVKKVEGVQSVENEIEVLPLSRNDDRLRAAVYYNIYSHPAMTRYTANRGPQFLSLTRRTMGITQDPPQGWHAIHIIVKNGNVTLLGVVQNESDAAIAGMRANLTPGVFSVDNDLMVPSRDTPS
jgi:hyperosmotically inducible periplasmic protein